MFTYLGPQGVIGNNILSDLSDNEFMEYLKQSFPCSEGIVPGHDVTYYKKILSCQIKNKGNLEQSCREIAKGCIEEENMLSDALVKVMNEMSSTEKEDMKNLHMLPFNLLEQSPDMRALIQKCSNKIGVEEQWFWEEHCHTNFDR